MLVNSRNIKLRMSGNKPHDLVKIMLIMWNSLHKRFTLREAASLLGLESNLSLTTKWFKYTFVALHHATSLALKFNSNAVLSSGKHRNLIDLIRSKSINVKNFHLPQAYKIV